MFIDRRSHLLRHFVGNRRTPHRATRLPQYLDNRRTQIEVLILLRAQLSSQRIELRRFERSLLFFRLRLGQCIEAKRIALELDLNRFPKLCIVVFEHDDGDFVVEQTDVDGREFNGRNALGQRCLFGSRKRLGIPTSQCKFTRLEPYQCPGFASLYGPKQTRSHDDVGRMPNVTEQMTIHRKLRYRLIIQRPLSSAQHFQSCFKKSHDLLSARQLAQHRERHSTHGIRHTPNDVYFASSTMRFFS